MIARLKAFFQRMATVKFWLRFTGFTCIFLFLHLGWLLAGLQWLNYFDKPHRTQRIETESDNWLDDNVEVPLEERELTSEGSTTYDPRAKSKKKDLLFWPEEGPWYEMLLGSIKSQSDSSGKKVAKGDQKTRKSKKDSPKEKGKKAEEKEKEKKPRDPVLSLRPLLEKGIVVLLKNRGSASEGKECVTYSLIDAPLSEIHKKMKDYESLKDRVPRMAESKIVRRKGNTIDVYYEIEIPLAPNISYTQRHTWNKDGTIEVKSLGGVKGQWKWIPHPVDGGKRTIMAYHSKTDITEQGWLLKKILKKQPAVREAINSSGAIITMSSLHNQYSRGPRKGQRVSLSSLMPFLKEGTLSLIKDKKVGTIHPIITYSLIRAPRDDVWALTKDFESYPQFVPQLAEAEIIRVGSDFSTFDIRFSIDFPLLNFDYINRYKISDKNYTLRVNSIQGARGKFHWKFYKMGGNTIVKYSALANISDIGFWNKIINQRPDLEKALNISISQIVLRAIQKKGEEEQRQK